MATRQWIIIVLNQYNCCIVSFGSLENFKETCPAKTALTTQCNRTEHQEMDVSVCIEDPYQNSVKLSESGGGGHPVAPVTTVQWRQRQ